MGDGGGEHWLVRMEWRPARWSVSASVNLPLHNHVQKFCSGTGWPGWSRKTGRKTVVVCICGVVVRYCACECVGFVIHHDIEYADIKNNTDQESLDNWKKLFILKKMTFLIHSWQRICQAYPSAFWWVIICAVHWHSSSLSCGRVHCSAVGWDPRIVSLRARHQPRPFWGLAVWWRIEEAGMERAYLTYYEVLALGGAVVQR